MTSIKGRRCIAPMITLLLWTTQYQLVMGQGSYCDGEFEYLCPQSNQCIYKGFRCDGERGDCLNNADEISCPSSICGDTLTADTGTITFPTQSTSYPPNSNCTWIIQGAEDTHIRLHIKKFDLQAASSDGTGCYGWLEIIGDKSQPDDGLILCGATDDVPSLLTYEGNYVWLQFQSDGSTSGTGFEIDYEIDSQCTGAFDYFCNNGRCIYIGFRCDTEDDCGDNSDELACPAPSCGGELTPELTGSGEITTPNYPSNYPNQVLCKWIFRGATGSKITLDFRDFNLQEPEGGSYIEGVYRNNCSDGIEILESKSLGYDNKFGFLDNSTVHCGSDRPGTYTSKSNFLWIQFVADSTIQDSGFRIEYFDCPRPGYWGSTCSIEIDECVNGPCKNTGRCTDMIDAYECTCPEAFTGVNCETENLVTMIVASTSLTLEEPFVAALLDPSSSEYQDLASEFTALMTDSLSSHFDNVECEVTGFRNGTLVVSFVVRYPLAEKDTDIPDAEQDAQMQIQEAVTETTKSGSLGSFTVRPESFEIASVSSYRVQPGICEDPGDIENGYRSIEDASTAFVRGIYVRYSCYGRYDLVGESIIYCSDSLTWTNPVPMCILGSDEDDEIENEPDNEHFFFVFFGIFGVAGGALVIIFAVVMYKVRQSAKARSRETATAVVFQTQAVGRVNDNVVIMYGDSEHNNY